MQKLISSIDSAVFYDPATGDAVQVDAIDPRGTSVSIEPIKRDTATGNRYGGTTFNGELTFYDTEGTAQLDDWQDDGAGGNTKLNFAAAGSNEFILMNENEDLTFARGTQIDAREGPAIHTANIKTRGYRPAVAAATNLITAGSGVFDQFNDGTFFRYIFNFPIEGVEISAGADYANYAIDSAVQINIKDFNGSPVENVSTTVDADGRFSVSAITPAGAYEITVAFDLDNEFSDGDITNRTIRLGSNSNYVNF